MLRILENEELVWILYKVVNCDAWEHITVKKGKQYKATIKKAVEYQYTKRKVEAYQDTFGNLKNRKQEYLYESQRIKKLKNIRILPRKLKKCKDTIKKGEEYKGTVKKVEGYKVEK